MKGTFLKGKRKDKGFISIVMETPSKDSGNMMKNIQVSTTIKMEEFLKANSTKEKCHMELWFIPMDKVTKGSFKMDRDTVLVSTATLLEQFCSKVNGLMMTN